MTAIIILILILSLGYILYIITEHIINEKTRKKIRLVIHINGIRGKSTVTRLIGAGISECGLRTFTKTTGTIPMIIDGDGKEKKIKRKGLPNIREQISVLRLAKKDKAEVLVVECMAVNPELQYICEHRILHSNIGVITNVRRDHLDEMGDNLQAIAKSLSNTIPENGTLILGEEKYREIFEESAKKVNAKIKVPTSCPQDLSIDFFEENIAIALAVCEQLGLNKEKFIQGMKKYHKDPGVLSAYKIQDTIFINAFSVNDPDSTSMVYQKMLNKFEIEDMTILLNSRSDRAFRTEQHLEMLQTMKVKKVLLMGSNGEYLASVLKRKGIECCIISFKEQLLQEKYIFGCGNIAEDGMKILNYFQENGEAING